MKIFISFIKAYFIQTQVHELFLVKAYYKHVVKAYFPKARFINIYILWTFFISFTKAYFIQTQIHVKAYYKHVTKAYFGSFSKANFKCLKKAYLSTF